MCSAVHAGGGDGFPPAAQVQLRRRWAHRPGVARVMGVVDRAARLLDSGSLRTTRFLSRHPHARLAVACYVLLLHLWVLVVLMHLAPGSRAYAIARRRHHAGLAHVMPPAMPGVGGSL